MNIVYYSSDLFSEMCGVAIQSLCENNKDADDKIGRASCRERV